MDLDKHRSSIKTLNLESQRIKIYYNEVNSYGRNFIVFEEDRNSCKSSSVYQWPLAQLRTVSLRMLPTNKLTSDLCDVAMGPSSLLLTISETLSKFRYVTNRFSDTRLAEVDIYERFLRSSNRLDLKPLLITLYVQSSNHKVKPKVLGDIHSAIDVLSIVIGEIEEEVGINRETKNVEEEHSYDEGKVLTYIDYYIVTKMQQTSLIGQTLDETGEFNFHRDPFVHPIGLGCWYNYGSSRESTSKPHFRAVTVQFSATYVSSNGSSESTYVAYNGYNNMLRMDNGGRKSIYELDRGLSYHVGEFSAIKETTDSVNHGKNCIALDIKDKRFSSSLMLERLLGFGSTSGGSAGPHYIGSKLIEQISYEVYEMEIVFGRLEDNAYVLPIILEPVRFVMPAINMGSTKSYFLTYYVTELAHSQNLRFYLRAYSSELDDGVFVPKYIELWELNRKGSIESSKNLINRLEFTQFSWALDVEPNGDPDSRDLSHLFAIPSCAQERSTQLAITYPVKQKLAGKIVNRDMVSAFQANKQLVKEVIYENLATQLDIPRINIAYVDVSFPSAKSADFVVETRVIELPQSLTVDTLVGFAQVSQILTALKGSVVSMKHNRHSLDDCKLDSLTERTKNALMYCEGLTTCILLKAEDASRFDQYQQKEQPELLRSADFSKALCAVHLFNWAQWTQANIINRVYENKYRVNSNLVIPFAYKKKDSSSQIVEFHGIGNSYDVMVKSLDPVGLVNSLKSSLVGFRHVLVQEDKKAVNLNYAVSLDGIVKQEDQFKYCHFACQLDDYCESFSYCSRKKGSQAEQTDCVISALRLTRGKIAQLDAELKKNPAKDNLQVLWTLNNMQVPAGEVSADKRVYRFKYDQACNLHPKDFLEAFKLKRAIQVQQVEHKTGAEDNDTESHEVGLTLEECAASSHEQSFERGTLDSSFTFCPLSALCLANRESVAGLDIEQTCYVYRKDATRFYHKRAHSRLVIKLSEEAKFERGSPKLLDLHRLEQLKLGRIIEVQGEEQCARECNLHQANCLSFDSCLSGEGSFCLLYSIRSPSQSQRKLKYLPQEEQFYGDGKSFGQIKTSFPRAFISESFSCNHFAIESLYLNIRVQQMAQRLRGNQTEGQESLRAKVDQLERDRLAQDEAIGGRSLERLLADKTDGLGSGAAQAEASNGLLVHLLLLLLSASLGCMATLYASQVALSASAKAGAFRSFLQSVPARSSRVPQQLAMIVRSGRQSARA